MNIFTDIKKLRAFVMVAEEGSVTQAARRLNVAQPWLSEQLRRLELTLGLSLFERATGKPPKLTRQGGEFLDVARKVLESCEEAAAAIDAIRNGDESSVSLGVDPISLFIPERNELIQSFRRSWPGINLHIESRRPFELFDGLVSHEYDAILTTTPERLDDFDVLVLFLTDLYLMVPRTATQEYEKVVKGQLSGLKILTLPDSYHPLFFHWLNKRTSLAGLEPVVCPEHNIHALIQYACMLGISTILPDLSASLPEMKRDLHIRKLRNPATTIQWSLVRRKGVARGPADKLWQHAKSIQSGD